jgi:hypothetical protein
MSDRGNLIVKRMTERLCAIYAAVPPIDPPASYWLDSDAGPSYCKKCVKIARGKEFDLGAPIVDEVSYNWDDWVGAFYDGIDGGFDTHSDSTQACEICGCTLSYILSDYGVDEEIEYYLESPIVELRPEDSYALDRLTLNIWGGGSRKKIVGAAAIVNRAWRLLQAPSE